MQESNAAAIVVSSMMATVKSTIVVVKCAKSIQDPFDFQILKTLQYAPKRALTG
jgi:hypothetical protein